LKQIDPRKIESPEEQERRARQRIRPKPMVICALVVGAVVFVIPAGGPWMSQEGFISAMGRLLTSNPFVNLLGQFVLALLYGWLVAASIYRFRTLGGIVLGAILSIALYGLNYFIFVALLQYKSNELHVFLAHLTFCLFFSAAYKAASVPRPRWKDTGKPVEIR
jgi:hypothetical protein